MDNIQPGLDEWAQKAREQLEKGVREMDDQQPHHFKHNLPNSGESDDITAAAAAAAAAAVARADSSSHLRASRVKVSRACDECRRKKVRCDADPEKDTSSCTACQKSNKICRFSHEPAKRGPSKGYIKELADRVSLLEHQKPPSGLPLSDDHQPIGSGVIADDLKFLDSNVSQLASIPHLTRNKRSYSEAMERNGQHAPGGQNGNPAEQHLISLDAAALQRYVHCIHRTTPILSNTSDHIRSALTKAPEPTQHAFLAVFHTSMRSAPYTGDPHSMSDGTAIKAYQAYSNSNFMDSPNMLQLQCLLLLVIDSSNRGALIINGSQGTPPWSLLDQAVAKSRDIDALDFAFGIKLPEAELDMNYRITRGTLLSMMILDAFLAFGNRKHGPSMDHGFIHLAERDLDVVGQRTYRLARLARILQRLNNVRIDEDGADSGLQLPPRNGIDRSKRIHLTSDNINIIANFKEMTLDALVAYLPLSDPVLQMAFWYTRLQIEVHYFPLAVAKSLIYPCKKIVGFLAQQAGIGWLASTCPLTFHFSGLTAHVIIQLYAFSDTRAEAMQMLESLENSLQVIVPASDAHSFDAGVRDAVARQRALIAAQSLPGQSPSHYNSTTTGPQVNGTSNDALQAASEAAAKAAKEQMNVFQGHQLSREGYLTSLLVHDA